MVIYELNRNKSLKLVNTKPISKVYDIGEEYNKFYYKFRKKLKNNDFRNLFNKFFMDDDDKLMKKYLNYFYISDYYNVDFTNSLYIDFNDSIDNINLKNYKTKLDLRNNYNKQIVNLKGKTNLLSATMVYYDDIKEIDYICDRQKVNLDYTYFKYLYCFDKLNKNGDLVVNIYNICEDNVIEYIYLGLLLFEKVSVYATPDFRIFFYYQKFNPTMTKNEFTKLYNKPFTIKNKNNINELLDFIFNQVKYNLKLFKSLYEERMDDFMNQLIYIFLRKINYNNKDVLNQEFYLYIFKNFKKIFIDKELVKVHSNISLKEGNFISNIIKKNNFKKCLEVGMAFGISSFYILKSLQNNGSLISIDPFQKSQWKSYGLKLLKSTNLNKKHSLIEKKSFVALPELLKNNENKFDFIFIDGWHTFDYTLIDFFYSDLLLKTKGIIVIDDALHDGVKKVVKYIESNFKNYRKLNSPRTNAVFLKLADDSRNWNFHRDF